MRCKTASDAWCADPGTHTCVEYTVGYGDPKPVRVVRTEGVEQSRLALRLG